ncbi:hypothetical protein GC163_20210 [bacterium]|nr:hypothetical protein [bacterium]
MNTVFRLPRYLGSRRAESLATLAVLMLLASGCGLPTWSELIGTSQPQQQPVVQQPQMVPPPQVTMEPPPPPPPPQPQEIIDKFKSLTPIQIDDNALLSLSGLEEGLDQITELNLAGTTVTNNGIRELNKLTYLTKLDIRGSLLDKESLESVAKAESLESLYLDGTRIDDTGAAVLKSLSQLKVLHADRAILKPFSWQDLLLSHPDLEELHISDSNINDLTMASVGKLKNLKRLFVTTCQVSDDGLAQLADVDGLEELNISGCPITGIGFRPPGGGKGFNTLQKLTVQRCPLDERGAKALITLKELTYLNLAEMQNIQDTHFKTIVKALPKLEVVSFWSNPALTNQSLSAFNGNKVVKFLDFGNNRLIDDAGLKFLTKCSSLEKIAVLHTGCTPRGVLALREIYPNLEVDGL